MTTTELLHPLRRKPAPLSANSTPARSRASVTSERADPTWARPALVALLLLTAIAYLWDLSASGYANSFYAAAAEAGTKSWKAFFFGSLDSSNFITVDKPPASLWVMSLSGRIFGFSSWSMLVPQALEGVAAVWLLFAAVKRWFGAGTGLAAGAVFALTPVAALMFRFNNPDALLVLLLVAGAYCLTRALEHARTGWVLAAGTLIGFAFLAKMMQAFIVLPGFALVYIVAAPTSLGRRARQILAGGIAVLLSAGWWVAIVALWPAGSRPMIDGSQENSILDLITGYNGLGRIVGNSGPSGVNFSGATGPLRLFNDLMGAQGSWLLPAALLALIGGVWARRRAPRTDRTRAALLLWGGWLVITAAVFSFGQGVIHTYYVVALAPAMAALVAIGGKLLWDGRERRASRAIAAIAVGGSAVWAYALLARTPSWEPWLRPLVLCGGLIAALGWLAAPELGRLARRASLLAATVGVLAVLAGPVAYSADTIATAHTGSIVSAGPVSTSGAGGTGGSARTGGPGGGSAAAARPGGSAAAGGSAPGAAGAPPSGFPGNSGAGASSARASSGTGLAARAGIGGGEMQVSAALTSALKKNADTYRWVAATAGSQSAASLELATGAPVMAIGGFSNEGGNLTLAAFEQYVAAGDLHYYIASGGGGGTGMPGAGSSSSSITAWVKAHFAAKTIGGQTVYDLTAAA
jgi:4-amino-4-deoxy-L-arabinose transferase-like glycosyltransferase